MGGLVVRATALKIRENVADINVVGVNWQVVNDLMSIKNLSQGYLIQTMHNRKEQDPVVGIALGYWSIRRP